MTRAYIRLDPQFDERKESYPDGPYRALVACLCLAEAQPVRGRFRSLGYLKNVLGRTGKHVPYLVEHGDLIVLTDGRVYIEGWDEWQEGDWKVGERVRRIRARRNGLGNGPDRIQGNGLERAGGGRSPSDAGAGADLAVTTDRAAVLSDEERREHLDRLAEILDANGVLPERKANGEHRRPYPATTDTEVIERARAIIADESAPAWKREAARAQLEVMRVQP